ncbi:hypothetical protein E3N88_25548 [Mikania micrantha]|uniref:Uncharacterized protein n=1 Tax=Mikania micrantha TaxID=192012 RepID=A0A5N6N6P1_9ASTR|nr:hypothetical protein E3N88_25548 [Mikania micrantha]
MSNSYIINPHILSGIAPEVDNVVRDIMSSSEYIVNKLVKDMKRLTIFRDTLKDIMDQTDEETRDRRTVKQKDIVSSFVPQHEESSVNVRVLGTKVLVRIKGLNLNVNKQSTEWALKILFQDIHIQDVFIVLLHYLDRKMTSSSSTYKYQKDEKAIEILEKSFSEEKKDDMIMRNSIGMLNGLLIADIRSNIANLSDLLDDTDEGAEMA